MSHGKFGSGKPPPDEIVKVWDFKTQTMNRMPARELRPGLQKITLRSQDGSEEQAYADLNDTELSGYRHGPFDQSTVDFCAKIYAKMADSIKSLSDGLSTFEKFMDGFRCDMHPEKEIAIWHHIAECYTQIISAHPFTPTMKRDVLAITISAISNDDEQGLLNTIDFRALSKREALKVIRAVKRYQGGGNEQEVCKVGFK
jgi:hypothetical protein